MACGGYAGRRYWLTLNCIVMKVNWITVAAITSLGLVTVLTAGVVSIINKVDYEVLSYQIQTLDNKGITFRIMLGVINPSSFDIDVWNQKYDVFIAGYKVSEVSSSDPIRLIRANTSTLPLDIYLKWTDITEKLAPIASQSDISQLNELPVLIKGKLAARVGFLRFTRIPIRIPGRLGWYLP